MKVWKIIFLSEWVICRFHVNLPGCTFSLPCLFMITRYDLSVSENAVVEGLGLEPYQQTRQKFPPSRSQILQ